MIVLEFFIELVVELFGEILLELGLSSLEAAFDRENRNPILATLGYLLLGAAIGGVFVWVHPERLTPRVGRPGTSLLLAPLAGGVVMHLWGVFRRTRGHNPTQLATAYGGAAFMLGLALVRFLLVK